MGRSKLRKKIGNHAQKKPLGRSKCRCDHNIKMNFKEIGCGLDSNGSGYVPIVSSCELGNKS